MPRSLFTLACLTAMLFAKAQYPGYTLMADAANFKKDFATAAQKTNTIKSNFVQEKNLSMLDEKMVSQGKFWFKKENRIRMEYEKPFQYLLVINNSQVFVRDGEKENRISARSNKVFGQVNHIMIDCVQGSILNNREFSSRVFQGNLQFLVELIPLSKSMKELFNSIIVQVDKKDFSASRIELDEINGDKTVIKLINKELNAEIPDSLFVIH